MKILYVIKGLGLGGAEKHVAQLAQAFKAQGHTVQIAYLLDYKDAWVRPLAEAGVPVTCIGGGKLWPVLAVVKMAALLQRFKPDLVHAHLPISGVYARLMKSLSGYRLVYTEHNELDRLHPLTKRVHAWTHRLDDAAISCSQAVADSLRWDSQVVDNGITEPLRPAKPSLRSTHGIPSDAVVFICVANMTPKKNHAMLIQAFDCAADRCEQDIRLVLVGQDATEGGALRAQAQSLKNSAAIVFWGQHPCATDLMYEADVFVLASNHEGLPISLLEAMSVGLPSIVTCAGGMRAVVGDNCGVAIDIGARDQLTDAVVSLAGDRDARCAMGGQAKRRIAQSYSQSSMVERIFALYLGDD